MLESAKRPLRMEEIQEQINDSFEGLRKTDGTKYRGDKTKAINGALYSTGIFRRVNEKWVIKPLECEQYERRMLQKLETRGKRRKAVVAENDPNGEEVYVKRKYTRRQVKRSVILKMLKNTSDRLRVSSNEHSAVYFKNPFQVGVRNESDRQGLTGTEELVKLRKKLGEEKFEMAIQMYNYFEDIFSNVSVDGDAPVNATANEQTTRLIDQMQRDVLDLKVRLNQIEKMNELSILCLCCCSPSSWLCQYITQL